MVVVVGRWVWFGCWIGSAAAVGAGAEIAGIGEMITVSLSSIITIMIVIGRV